MKNFGAMRRFFLLARIKAVQAAEFRHSSTGSVFIADGMCRLP